MSDDGTTRGGPRPGAGRPPNPWQKVIKAHKSRNARRRARYAAEKARGSDSAKPATKAAASDKVALRRRLAQLNALVVASQPQTDPQAFNPFKLPEFPPGVGPKKDLQLAMDDAMAWGGEQFLAAFAGQNTLLATGLAFPGFAYLSQLAQRPEYRVMCETIAEEMTRKWITFKGVGEDDAQAHEENDEPTGEGEISHENEDLTGDKLPSQEEMQAPPTAPEDAPGEELPDDVDEDLESGAKKERSKEIRKRIKELTDFMNHLGVRAAYHDAILKDNMFGRAHLFHEIAGNDGKTTEGQGELKTDLGDGRGDISKAKVGPNNPLTAIRCIEPIWTYPLAYNALNPLSGDWYNPQVWYTMSREIHVSRILPMIGRPVPDLLKPSYAFGGVSLTQMAQPYVNIWLETRESVARLVHSFSVMVLSTDLQTLLQDSGGEFNPGSLIARARAFNANRDNQGVFLLNKATEEFSNVQVSLAGLHELQAQAQEHMSLPAGVRITTTRGDIPIECVTADDLVLTRAGFAPVQWAGITGTSNELVEIEVNGTILRVTGNHPIWSESTSEFVNAENVSRSHRLLVLKVRSRVNTANRLFGVAVGGGAPSAAITAMKKLADFCIASCGKFTAGLFRWATKFITPMTMARTIHGTTLSLSLAPFMRSSTGNSAKIGFKRPLSAFAEAVATVTPLSFSGTSGAADDAGAAPIDSVRLIKVPRQLTYDIVVADGWPTEFYANGVLVHNCSVSKIPAVKFTGLQPSGMNASAEGEIRVFEDTIHAAQERIIRPLLQKTIWLCMLSLWGEVDENIVFEFVPLREMTEKEEAELGKLKAETDDLLMNGCQAIGPHEVRQRLASDPESDYPDLDPDEEPDLPEPQNPEGAGGKVNLKGNEGYAGPDGAPEGGGGEDHSLGTDAEFNEADHPRAPDGKFGSGGSATGKKNSALKTAYQQSYAKGFEDYMADPPNYDNPYDALKNPMDAIRKRAWEIGFRAAMVKLARGDTAMARDDARERAEAEFAPNCEPK